MGRSSVIIAAMLLVCASGAGGAEFEILSDAGIIRPPTPLEVRAGSVVKAEFKSSLKTTPDEELEPENLLPEAVAATDGARKSAKPAVAYKERTRGMAPPAKTAPKADPSVDAATKDTHTDVDGDLEKDLVLSPPPPRTEEKRESVSPSQKKTPPPAVLTDRTAEPKKSAPKVRHIAPPEQVFAKNGKAIRKVKPVTGNPWMNPAGSAAARPYGFDEEFAYLPVDAAPPARGRIQMPPMVAQNRPASSRLQEASPNTAVVTGRDRFVHDGVTVKLAPAAAPSIAAAAQGDSESDILSTVTEIIGMPFALISSFF